MSVSVRASLHPNPQVAQQYLGQPTPSTSSAASKVDMDSRVAHHLAHAYGDRAGLVLKVAEDQGLGRRLVGGHPYLEAEVVYCAQVGAWVGGVCGTAGCYG